MRARAHTMCLIWSELFYETGKKIISNYEICNLNIFLCARRFGICDVRTPYIYTLPDSYSVYCSHFAFALHSISSKNVNYLKIYYCVFITFVCVCVYVLALTMARVYFTHKEQIKHAAPAAAAATTTTAAMAKRKTTMYVYIKI